jgi:hypothetical protein
LTGFSPTVSKTPEKSQTALRAETCESLRLAPQGLLPLPENTTSH